MKQNFIKTERYAAPACETLETAFEGVLCQSIPGTSIQDWEQDNETL